MRGSSPDRSRTRFRLLRAESCRTRPRRAFTARWRSPEAPGKNPRRTTNQLSAIPRQRQAGAVGYENGRTLHRSLVATGKREIDHFQDGGNDDVDLETCEVFAG